MTYRIVTRAEIGLPVTVTNSNGTPRPPLRAASWLTAHYTGNAISYVGKDVAASIRLIQSVFAKTKPFEYNYVIGLPEDDLIYEFAGDFVAAHSAGENAQAVGVLFLVGVDDVVSSTMINKWRWLRDRLAVQGVTVTVGVVQAMHFQMPGAATACPGNSIKAQWPQFLGAYVPPSIPSIPTFEDEEIMIAYIAQPPTEMFGQPWLVVINGAVRYATSHDTQQGLPFVQLNAEQYPFLKKSAGL